MNKPSIQEAAKKLLFNLDREYPQGSLSIAHDENTTIYVFIHVMGLKLIKIKEFEGFSIKYKYVGKLKPA